MKSRSGAGPFKIWTADVFTSRSLSERILGRLCHQDRDEGLKCCLKVVPEEDIGEWEREVWDSHDWPVVDRRRYVLSA